MKKNKVKSGLIIIPARSGSKGIKNKNIVDVFGKPLIAYTIKPALKIKKSGLISEAIVSTNSIKIANISKKLGINVPFLRPKKISGDKSKSVEFILHALDFFKREGVDYDYVVLLQPTSPLRNAQDIEGAIKLFLKYNHDSLISVSREEKNNDVRLYYKRGNIGIPLSPHHNKGARRQDLEEIFLRNAGVYITSTKFLREKRQIISDNPLLYETPRSRSLDIDTKEDLDELRKKYREILVKKK